MKKDLYFLMGAIIFFIFYFIFGSWIFSFIALTSLVLEFGYILVKSW